MQRMNIGGSRPRISNAGVKTTHAQFLGQAAPA
jgi:hypothetical protein